MPNSKTHLRTRTRQRTLIALFEHRDERNGAEGAAEGIAAGATSGAIIGALSGAFVGGLIGGEVDSEEEPYFMQEVKAGEFSSLWRSRTKKVVQALFSETVLRSKSIALEPRAFTPGSATLPPASGVPPTSFEASSYWPVARRRTASKSIA